MLLGWSVLMQIDQKKKKKKEMLMLNHRNLEREKQELMHRDYSKSVVVMMLMYLVCKNQNE